MQNKMFALEDIGKDSCNLHPVVLRKKKTGRSKEMAVCEGGILLERRMDCKETESIMMRMAGWWAVQLIEALCIIQLGNFG